MKQEQAHWNGELLSMLSDYDFPEPHQVTHLLRRVALASPEADYFCATDGITFGLHDLGNTTCIATVESALHHAGTRASYVTFALRDRTGSSIARWAKKWSKRTAHPGAEENTVRYLTPIGSL